MARAVEQSAVETDGRSRQNSAYRYGRTIKSKIVARFYGRLFLYIYTFLKSGTLKSKW